MAKTTQDRRYIQLSTPLGKDELLISRLRCQEDLSKLFRIELDLLKAEDNAGLVPTLIDPKKLIGNPMSISAHQAGPVERFFHGICVRFTQGGRNGRFSEYKAELVPKVWLLTQVTQSRIFQDMTVPAILEEVLKGFDFTNDIRGTWEKRNFCVQYRESDWDFVSRLMEEEGIFYFFRHQADSHTLVLGNEPPTNIPCPSKAAIAFALDRSELKDNWIPAIYNWQVDNQMRTGKYELRDFHFQLPTHDLKANQTSLLNIGKNQELEFYDHPGDYAKRFDGIDIGGAEQPAELQKVFEDRRRTVKIRQEEIDVAYKNIYATSDCCSITAGHRFELQHHPHKQNNIAHVIVSAQIEALQSPSYISDDDVPGGYVVNFVCMPHGGGHPPYRPLRLTPKPIVQGSQTAIVVGKPGEEITTDKYGRVKVHFHWDRSDKNDTRGSCWLRVATNSAGNKWGTMYLPRVGQEVMIDFLEGDPDRPIIVGCVYNEQTMPHYELPKYKTYSYIKTHSTPGGKGFNELRFEDKKDKEQVFIHSQRRMDVRVRASFYETCGGNRQEVIGMRTDNYPGGNLAVSVGGSHDLHVKYDERITVDKKRYEIVTGDVFEGYEGKKVTLITGKSEQNADEIILEANTKISLKVGASCIVIEPALITIAAQMVKINSGGFGTETSDPDIACAMDAEYSDNGEPGYLDRPRTGGGKKGPVWRKFKSKHHAYPPRKDESAAFTAMRNKLNKSPEGRRSLEVFERNQVQITNNAGGTTYSGKPKNSVNLDPARTDSPASGFVHEMGHADAEHGGTKADVKAQNKADYIDTQLREDAKAERRAYEAEEQMNAAGESERYNSSTRTKYQNTLAAERARLRAAEPGISDAELNRRSHDAAEAAILKDYKDGNVKTGNTTPPQSYVDYWGGDHDNRHGSGSPGPAPDPHGH